MYVSDFTQAQSTQQLLYMLFCSEIGLLSVSHPAVQMEGVRSLFSTLQKNIVDDLRAGRETFEMSIGGDNRDNVTLSWRTDAQLFKKVYEGMARLSDVEEETVLNRRIYPLVGGMVLGNASLKQKTTQLLRAHIERYGKPVGKRIGGQLGAFNLQSLVHDIMPVTPYTAALEA